jgi:hypothetical protein
MSETVIVGVIVLEIYEVHLRSEMSSNEELFAAFGAVQSRLGCIVLTIEFVSVGDDAFVAAIIKYAISSLPLDDVSNST